MSDRVVQGVLFDLPEKSTPRQDCWIVIACGPEGVWSQPSVLRGGMYLTREAATKAAEGLSGVYWKKSKLVFVPGE